MATDVLTTLQARIRGLLADTASLFTDAIVDAGIFESVGDISRLAPRELMHLEVLHTRTISAETVTASDDTWVDMANKPLDMQQTVLVTNSGATVTYTEYTDYIIDYAQGRIQTLGAGAISDMDSIRVTYEKSLRAIDKSSLTDFISIDRIEVAKQGGQDYQLYSDFYEWGDLIWLQARGSENQSPNLSENDHIPIWYRAEHTKPGVAAGSYPAYMDDMVVKGGAAYALFGKHRELTLQVVTDLASARTALALADDDQSAMDTLFTAITTALDSAKTSIALVDAIADVPLADAELALDNLITQLGSANADRELGAAQDILNDVTGAIKEALDKITSHLETDATNPDSAQNQLKTGDAFINATNLGSDAAALHARYAEIQSLIARGFEGKAMALISQAQGLVNVAAQRSIVSANYTDEAQGRLGIAQALLNAGLGYIQEAQGRVQTIDRHVALGQLYLGQARGYQETADRDTQAADRFLFDAQERHRDYWEHLRSRVESSRPNTHSSSTKQNP